MTTDSVGSRAYVLHVRPYTDSRVIVEFFTLLYGRVNAVARTSSKKPNAQFLPFSPLHICFLGKNALKTLTQIEVFSYERTQLVGKLSFCGFYINELTSRLFLEGEGSEAAFQYYEQCLCGLALVGDLKNAERYLRQYEFHLLEELGYGLDFYSCVNGKEIQAQKLYQWLPEQGFDVLNGDEVAHTSVDRFLGADLLSIGRGDYSQKTTLIMAKRLSRLVLQPLLGAKPLKSRELFL